MKVQKLSCRQARQMLYLLKFDFTLKHVPETKMGKVNGLNRRLDQRVGVENDNENKKLIKEEWIQGLVVVVVVVERPEVDIVEKIKRLEERTIK